MPQGNFGSTSFQWPDIQEPGCKAKITTAEGSTVAVPMDDLAQFITEAVVKQMVYTQLAQMSWQEILTGAAPGPKRARR